MVTQESFQSTVSHPVRQFSKASWIPLIVLLLLSYVVFFWRLGDGGIRQWDEASLALNALEMTLNNNPIVKYLDSHVDLINTKPPLLIWAIAGCMKLLGYNAWAVRLPSAMAATALVLIVYFFGTAYLHSSGVGLVSALVLLTSFGFTGEHVARTGDYDGALVLWVTIYSLGYFIYLNLEQKSHETTVLATATVALICAVWTKGVAGLLAVPGLFVYAALAGKAKRVFLAPKLYLAALCFLAGSLSYYILRESLEPGFLIAVVNNELWGRYMDVVPGGDQRGFLYYFKAMLNYRFLPWVYALPICAWIGFTLTKEKVRSFVLFGSIYFISYIFIISYSQTKFEWYDAPLYPITALIVGLGTSVVIDLVIMMQQYLHSPAATGKAIQPLFYSTLIITIIFLPLFNNIYFEIYRTKIPFRQNEQAVTRLATTYEAYFRELATAQLPAETNNLKVVNPYRYNHPLLFYTQVASLKSPYTYDVQWETPTDLVFEPGVVVVNCDANTQEKLLSRYHLSFLHVSQTCATVVLHPQ